MIFVRSILRRTYTDYTRYRALLRHDFRHRCAYCLMHEYFLGGEAGCQIDHFRPLKGEYARPDLEAEYTNLYWSCTECNQNKADTWPSAEEEALGYRFIDPCQPEDDHDLHWRVLLDGRLEALTPVGEYTIETLKLWRRQLRHHRARLLACQQEADSIQAQLLNKRIGAKRRTALEQRLTEINFWLDPPVFDRPHGRQDDAA